MNYGYKLSKLYQYNNQNMFRKNCLYGFEKIFSNKIKIKNIDSAFCWLNGKFRID